MFDNVEIVSTAKKPSRAKRITREIVAAGVKVAGACSLLITNIDSVQKTVTADLKSFALTTYIKEIYATGSVPETFNAIEEGDEDKIIETKPSANIPLKKRATNQPLSDDEIATLAEYNIPTGTITEGIEAFIFNPKELTPAVMAKIAAALKDVEGLPKNLIQKTEAKTKTIVSEETLPAICKLALVEDKNGKRKHTVSEIKALVEIATTISLKPSFGSTDLAEAHAVVAELVEFGGTKEASTGEAQKDRKVAATAALHDTLKASLAAETAKTDGKVKAKGRTKQAA